MPQGGVKGATGQTPEGGSVLLGILLAATLTSHHMCILEGMAKLSCRAACTMPLVAPRAQTSTVLVDTTDISYFCRERH